MATLVQQRCFTHGQREAVARCPGCGRFFCRECITEHADRVLCASCLKKQNEPVSARKSRLRILWPLLACAGSFFLAWLFFYLVGRSLLSIPTEFHEGTAWISE